MIIDTHAHIYDEKLTNTESVFANAAKLGVGLVIVPTTSLTNLDEVLQKSKSQKNVRILAGVHPEEIESVTNIRLMKEELRNRIKENKNIVGLGEIGLDFYYDKEKNSKDKQLKVFIAQMELASELNLPVAIHMREAEIEMIDALNNLKQIPKGQFHCFSGDSNFLRKILNWGFYVSFAGNITYKSAGNLRERLKETPLDRLLLETDSPYRAPEPVRGTINEPANVKIIAKFIAQELNQPEEKISEITQKNTICLYSLDI